MKKVFTLAMSIALATFSFGQSARTSLVEEGTNASCPPCAGQNPGFNALLDANPDNVVSIKYQAWWPGYDPMYEQNPNDVHNRIEYYGFNGVPTAMIDGQIIDGNYSGFDGTWYDGAPGGYSQDVIDNAVSFTSPFSIDIAYTLTPDGITVTPTATCSEDVSGNLKLHVAIVEKEINFDSAPGTNGEMVFENVMRKMLPTADGASMETSYSVGDTYTTTVSWDDLSNIYDIDQVAVVAYIQNDDTKEVLQAGFDDSQEFEPAGELNAAALNVDGLPIYSCEPTVSPSIVISNHGATELTALTIDWTLNDASGTVNWTGNLPFYENETVDLGEINFTPDGDDMLEVTLSNPNGGVDANTANDMVEESVALAGNATLDVTVEIHTDYYSEETSWEIRNSNDEVVASESYTTDDANTTVSSQVMLDPFDCHEFKLEDSYGDGMGYGPAGATYGYRVIDGFGNVILENLQGSFNFGHGTTAGLKTEDVLNVNEASIKSSLNLYPNPTNNNLNVAFELREADNISIDVYNLVGQLVSSKDFGTISSGYTLKKLNVSNLSAGFYMVNINTNDARIVRKITVTK